MRRMHMPSPCAWRFALVLTVFFVLSNTDGFSQSCAFRWADDFPAGDFDALVNDFASFDDGDGTTLYAGGEFRIAGGAPIKGIARLVDGEWRSLGDGILGIVENLLTFDDGSGPALYVTGQFSVVGASSPTSNIARWNGSSWLPAGGSLEGGSGFALEVFDDGNGEALYVGGSFTSVDGVPANRIAKWDGTSWSAVTTGCDSTVLSLKAADLGGTGAKLHVGGFFLNAGGVPASRIASFDGTTWAPLGVGADLGVGVLETFDDGGGEDLYAGGIFASIGGLPTSSIGRWDGSTWSSVGAGIQKTVTSILGFDDGSGAALYAGHRPIFLAGETFSLQRFNGTLWERVSGGPNDTVDSLGSFDDGGGAKLYAGGRFSVAGGVPASRVASWDGTQWESVASSDAGNGLSARPMDFAASNIGGVGDRLYAIGYFHSASSTQVNHIASWDGAAWAPLGSGLNEEGFALEAFDDGGGVDLYAGGRFSEAGGDAHPGIARWDGTTWSSVGGGVMRGGLPGVVAAMTVFDDGGGTDLYVGGGILLAGATPVSFVARWDGSAWSALGAGLDLDPAAMAVFDDGGGPALYVAGRFTQAGGSPARGIAVWDGSAWSDVGGSLDDGEGRTLAVHDDGTGPALYLGGTFANVGGQPIQNLAKWDGSSWSQVPDVINPVRGLAVLDEGLGDRLFALSDFTLVSGLLGNFGRWNGLYWEAVDQVSLASTISAVDPDGAGPERRELWVGGLFSFLGDTPSQNVGRYNFDRRPDQYVRLDFGEVGVPVLKADSTVLREDGSTLMTLDKGARAGFDPEELGYSAAIDRNLLIREIVDRVRSDFRTQDGQDLDVCFGIDVPDFSPYSTVSIVEGQYPDMIVDNSVADTEIRVEAATARLLLSGGVANGYFVRIQDGRLRRPDDTPVPLITFPEMRRIRVDAFGSAQMLDKGNVDRNKNAWVFVGEHSTSSDPEDNLSELVNSISHEMSHLLGLEHADGQQDTILGPLATYGSDKSFSFASREKLVELLPPGGRGGPAFNGTGLRTRQAKIGDSDQFGTSEPGVITGVADDDAAAIMREARLLLEPQATHEEDFEYDLGDVAQSDPEDGPFTDIPLSNGSIITYSLDLGVAGLARNFNGAYVEIALANVADVLGGPDDFVVLIEGVELFGALDGLDQRIADPDFVGYSCGERVTFFLPDYLTIPQIEAVLADGVIDVTLEVRGDTPFIVVDSILAIVNDRVPDAIRECGFGTVNLGGGKRAELLTVNGTNGGEYRTVTVGEGDPIAASIGLPSAGGTGRFVVHLDTGLPIESGVATLPAGMGTTCFPFLSPAAAPIAIWSNLGALDGPLDWYFGGPTPGSGGLGSISPAPTTFLSLPQGDIENLPPGTIVTFQGLIDDPASPSLRGLSTTNAVVLQVE